MKTTPADPAATAPTHTGDASPPQPKRTHRRRPRPATTNTARTMRAMTPILGLALLATIGGRAWPTATAPAGSSQTGTALARDRPAAGPVEISAIDVPMLWTQTADAHATIDLRNTTTRSASAQVWWMVSAVADVRPWLNPVETSPAEVVVLGPGQATKVTPPTMTALPPDGTYTISAWVHTQTNGASIPSDGAPIAADLTVKHLNPAIAHTHLTATSLLIIDAAVITDPRSADIRLQTTIANTSSRPMTINVTAHTLGTNTSTEIVIEEFSTRTVTLDLKAPASNGKPRPVSLTATQLRPDGTAAQTDQITVS